jgi:hypothetical protein
VTGSGTQYFEGIELYQALPLLDLYAHGIIKVEKEKSSASLATGSFSLNLSAHTWAGQAAHYYFVNISSVQLVVKLSLAIFHYSSLTIRRKQ